MPELLSTTGSLGLESLMTSLLIADLNSPCSSGLPSTSLRRFSHHHYRLLPPRQLDGIFTFHHHLKTSLKARLSNPNWMDELPLVLLSIRSIWKEYTGCSAADLVVCTSLKDSFNPLKPGFPPTEFLQHLQDTMRATLPTLPSSMASN